MRLTWLVLCWFNLDNTTVFMSLQYGTYFVYDVILLNTRADHIDFHTQLVVARSDYCVRWWAVAGTGY